MYYVGTPIPVEVTFDSPSLAFVAITVFDWSTGSPVQVGSPIPMVRFKGNSYGCLFTPADAAPYTVNKASYTDGTYTTFDDNEPQGSDAYQVIAAPGLGTSLVGSLQGSLSTPNLCAKIGTPLQIQGIVEVPEDIEGEI